MQVGGLMPSSSRAIAVRASPTGVGDRSCPASSNDAEDALGLKASWAKSATFLIYRIFDSLGIAVRGAPVKGR